MTPKHPVVWILGAGFSRGLGGPMLRDLLSLRSKRDLEARYRAPDAAQSVTNSTAAMCVYFLYHHGRRYPEGSPFGAHRDPPSGELVWQDAEEFLDHLDTAARDPRGPTEKRLLQLLRASMPEGKSQGVPLLRRAAWRIIAAECSAFLQNADLELERWGPYARWASMLTREDTIVSFNYDRVLEVLAAQGRAPLHVETRCDAGEIARTRTKNRALVLKLHGSVDWVPPEATDGAWTRSDDPEWAVSAGADRDVLMALPGPGKKLATHGVLAPLWDLATKALRDARTIVFVGYRFPPTDAHARQVLLDAISDNASRSTEGLTLHTVLGPQSRDDDERLEQLLRYAIRGSTRSRIVRNALFAEDFFSVWAREDFERAEG